MKWMKNPVWQLNVTKQQFCISCLRKKIAIWPGISQQPVNAGVTSGGFKVGGARGKTKKGAPLMTSSYSANRDKHFDPA